MNYPDNPQLEAALQAEFDMFGEAGIDYRISRINGYGDDEDTPQSLWGEPNHVGGRSYGPLLELISGVSDVSISNQLPTHIICITGQPAAIGEPEVQRMANFKVSNNRKFGQMGSGDIHGDGVSDRLQVPRQHINYPGFEWPSFIPSHFFPEPDKAPLLSGATPVDRCMVFETPEAAVESIRLVIAALENGGVTV